MHNLSNLALDFERKCQSHKAEALCENMATQNKDFNGLIAKLNRTKNLSKAVILSGTMLLDGNGIEKYKLRSHQVKKELGRGALGVVYLNKAPKIGRAEIIKTMPLSQGFEGEELDAARGCFFREAETACHLQQLSFVTIFDASAEHVMDFVDMESLKGKVLADVLKTGNLLPITKLLSINARVAEALVYAHKLNVVHPDIKPANVMCDFETNTAKICASALLGLLIQAELKLGCCCLRQASCHLSKLRKQSGRSI